MLHMSPHAHMEKDTHQNQTPSPSSTPPLSHASEDDNTTPIYTSGAALTRARMLPCIPLPPCDEGLMQSYHLSHSWGHSPIAQLFLRRHSSASEEDTDTNACEVKRRSSMPFFNDLLHRESKSTDKVKRAELAEEWVVKQQRLEEEGRKRKEALRMRHAREVLEYWH